MGLRFEEDVWPPRCISGCVLLRMLDQYRSALGGALRVSVEDWGAEAVLQCRSDQVSVPREERRGGPSPFDGHLSAKPCLVVGDGNLDDVLTQTSPKSAQFRNNGFFSASLPSRSPRLFQDSQRPTKNAKVMVCTHANMKAHSGMVVSPRNLSLILQGRAVLYNLQ